MRCFKENAMTVYSDLLKARDCVLLIVDMQKVMLDLCGAAGRCHTNVGALVKIAQLFKIPVVFSVHNRDKLGDVLADLLGEAPEAEILNKTAFSCLQDDALRQALTARQRKNLILCGIEAHVCIFQTGADAVAAGYRVHVVADAVSARSRMNQKIGLRRLEQAGAVISSTEMIIFELLKRAATPEFRKALPLIKTL
jgi:nicotinamidase-related amidase